MKILESARAASCGPGGLTFSPFSPERFVMNGFAMYDFARKLWTEDDGVLSFEWSLIVTLLVIGVVAGLSAARDAVIDELGDAAQAMLALDDSYVLDQPLELQIDLDGAGPDAAVEPGSAAGSSFTDAQSFTDCNRTPAIGPNQAGLLDSDS